MDQKLKERLIGTAVLVILAIALIPLLLVNTLEQELVTEDNIPDFQPGQLSSRLIPVKPIGTPLAEPQIEAEEKAVFVAAPNEIKEEASDAESVSAVRKNKDVDQHSPSLIAWVVQLGSFNDRDNAASLNQQLRDAGYPAFIESVHQDGEDIYRVRVGPELLRSDAEALLEKFNSTLNLKGVILHYP